LIDKQNTNIGFWTETTVFRKWNKTKIEKVILHTTNKQESPAVADKPA